MAVELSTLRQGFETAFIDGALQSNPDMQPQFVSNDYKQGRKVISSIEEELLACDEFCISVAFITIGGLTPLLQTLETLRGRGVKGRILTTDYLTFSDPIALEKLASLDNIELRMFRTDEAGEGFHTKGYIFKRDGIYHIITGSSNMTQKALTLNKEWNTKLISTEKGAFANELLTEFEDLWNSEFTYDYNEISEAYKTAFRVAKEQKRLVKQAAVPSISQYKLKPNSMQVEFINRLEKIRKDGEGKAILISATGTGKTYASAFAMREEKQNRVLFLVHREQIARQALNSYRNVFGDTKTFGLLSGTKKDFEADYLFSTMQMMAKSEIMERFDPEEFDTIIIDEVHRAGAGSYQKIMQYFQPRFWLGMTASPDRTDGFDIYGLFDHNIAYEIRLQKALEENLLCPFHYFGITDIEIGGEAFDDSSNLRDFSRLVSDQRVDYILEKANYYGHSGERVKGLIFCSRKEECRELSAKFNERGYRTTSLSGEDTQDEREDAINRLIEDGHPNQLDYIFTVDIFNEGVDIPEINQVIMLRPTESPIVFIQQLGRGLRKANDKDYVVIIDFIGNYKNNFMIPLALSGDRTYNKDTVRKYVMEGGRVIPGCSTIHFDEISKQRIFDAIDKMTVKSALLKEKYYQLKYKLGRIPTILDFYEYGEIDPMLFVEYSRTYDNFVRRYDSEYKVNFTEDESAFLEFVSSLLINGKRPHELLLIKMLIDHEMIEEERFISELRSIKESYRECDYVSALSVLNKDFINTQSERTKYHLIEFFDSEKSKRKCVLRAALFYNKLQKKHFLDELKCLVTYGLKKYGDVYSGHDEDNFVLYEKYSRKDVCRLLNWEKDDSSTVYGYRIKYNTCPIFVTYNKDDDISKSTLYRDEFVNEQVFSWMTRNRVTIDSPESQQIINYHNSGLKIYLFIKKSDGEGTDFYYMGRVHPIDWNQTTIKDNAGQELPIMNFQMQLEHSVRNDIYEYLKN